MGGKEEAVAALDHGVLRGIDPRRKQSFREGLAPETKPLFLVGCYPSPSCLLSTQCKDVFRIFL